MTKSGLPFLLTTRKTIQFNPESDYWLDVRAFDALIVDVTKIAE